MRAPTHYLFAFLTGYLAQIPLNILPYLSFVSLIPDIDIKESTMGRFFRPIHNLIKTVEHRTVTHSIWACLAAALISSPFSWKYPLIAIWIFWLYFTHPLIDFFNIAGVQFLAPASKVICVSAYNDKYRMKVGSKKEYILMAVLALSSLVALNQKIDLREEIIRISGGMYESYAHAYDFYKKNSRVLNIAQVTFYSEKNKSKMTLTAPVVSMNSNFLTLWIDEKDRLKVSRMDIGDDKINLKASPKILHEIVLTGTQLKNLEKHPKAFFNGEIFIANMDFPIESGAYLTVTKDSAGTKIVLSNSTLTDLAPVLNLNDTVRQQIKILQEQSPRVQMANLVNKLEEIDGKLKEIIEAGAYYDEYAAATQLETEKKGIVQRIEALKINILTNANKIEADIKKLSQVSVQYNITAFWYE